VDAGGIIHYTQQIGLKASDRDKIEAVIRDVLRGE
jgi:hypothetical protein